MSNETDLFDRKTRHIASGIAKQLRTNAVAVTESARLGDAIQAATRLALALEWGTKRVYWYGEETTLVLAAGDVLVLQSLIEGIKESLGDQEIEDALLEISPENPDQEIPDTLPSIDAPPEPTNEGRGPVHVRGELSARSFVHDPSKLDDDSSTDRKPRVVGGERHFHRDVANAGVLPDKNR